ncbi:MAG: hypothetical protein BGN86_11710 [Caulobacterales bacterium 68-7]|nr:MAG: hypothetical protein BGN86_11710 [Caulobacterales bacterium 68-7]
MADQPNVLVLLVDDEPLLLDRMEDVLDSGGFEVFTATGYTDALARLELNRAADIDALVTDIDLKSLETGWDLARHARSLKAELPVVYVTARSSDDWLVNGVPNSIALQKPFADAQLTFALAELLNHPSS